MGFEVSVRLSLGNVIMFQVFKSRHLRYCAEHFGVKGHIFHTVVDGYHHLVIKGSYEGHKAEVSCVLSNEDYKEYKKEHVK